MPPDNTLDDKLKIAAPKLFKSLTAAVVAFNSTPMFFNASSAYETL